MSDRFYFQMRQATGWCPGLPESYKKRRRKVAWTDEKKQEAVDAYVSEEPTPENTSKTTEEFKLMLNFFV